LLGLLLLLGGCCGSAPSAPTDPPPGTHWCDAAHAHACPIGRECMADGECLVSGEVVGIPGSCDPVACQAWEDLGTAGDGGDCAILCAAACTSTCTGDIQSIQDDRAQMEAEACDLGACRF
jgi:hypothetical protein